MKKSRFVTLIFCVLIGVLAFSLFYNILKPKAPRTPSPGYLTIAEEYIAAIEKFHNWGEVNIPEGTIFSYDGTTTIIKDIASETYVSCTYTLNGTVPVYSYHQKSVTLYAIFSIVCATFATFYCWFAIKSYSNNKKYKALNKFKSSATYGDNRSNASNCLDCYKKEHCACLLCPYTGECGKCPTIDCIDDFEDSLQENIVVDENGEDIVHTEEDDEDSGNT